MFKIIIIFLLSLYCKAQTTIVDLLDKDGSRTTDFHYKDVNNLLNPFEGTYLYTNGTTSFKIVLVKKILQYNGRFYEDLIIGEYQYIENGIEKVNTLSQLNTVYNNQRVHNIDGNSIIFNNERAWKCPTCAVNEKGLDVSIRDNATNRYANMYIRKTMIGSQEGIKIKICKVTAVVHILGTPMPLAFSLPEGEFTLVKQ